MIKELKNTSFLILFNFSLFLMLMIGIQNSTLKSKVNFIVNETVELPLSFIIGVSFISGSMFSNFLILKKNNNN